MVNHLVILTAESLFAVVFGQEIHNMILTCGNSSLSNMIKVIKLII